MTVGRQKKKEEREREEERLMREEEGSEEIGELNEEWGGQSEAREETWERDEEADRQAEADMWCTDDEEFMCEGDWAAEGQNGDGKRRREEQDKEGREVRQRGDWHWEKEPRGEG